MGHNGKTTALAAACALLTAYCATAPVAGPGETGWQSDHAFRVRAAGTPDAGEKSPAARKLQAKRAAITMAKYIALEDFTAQVYTALDDDTARHADVMARVRKDFGSAIAAGSAVSEKYHGDGSCAIIYEVQSPHLKQYLAKLRNGLMVRR